MLDVLDAGAVRAALAAARPDAIIYQATALTGLSFSRNMDRVFAPTSGLRTGGTDNLLAAAAEAGVPRFIAQSFAPFRYAHTGGPVKEEGDPLFRSPALGAADVRRPWRTWTRRSRRRAGSRCATAGSTATWTPWSAAVRKRQFPLIGEGNGMMSFIHLEDAAAATVLALDAEGPAIFNITDDEPAPMREWLPALAAAARREAAVSRPGWVGGLFMGNAHTR